MAFTVNDNAVWMVGEHAPWRMSDHAVDTMLDLFETAGQRSRFNELYELQRKAMGELFIERSVSDRPALRLVR